MRGIKAYLRQTPYPIPFTILQTTMDVPVLIIGAGPSGATAALHLGRLGIRSLVVSRHRGTANTPRAHIFNQRAMEVLRDAGIEDQCYEQASSMERRLSY